jgi:hypothetical protein
VEPLVGGEYLAMANSLSYYDTAAITTVKCLTVEARGPGTQAFGRIF